MVKDTEQDMMINSIFIFQDNVKEAKDLNLKEIKEEITNDEEYKKLIEAFKTGKNSKELNSNHPARKWASSWDHISMVTEEGPLIVNGEKIIIPDGLQKRL